MEKIKGVKKILERFDRDRKGISVMEAAQQICQLEDAECQERVERIKIKLESWVMGMGLGVEAGAPYDFLKEWEKFWQALKKREVDA